MAVARKLAAKHDIPFTRPTDYYAEMVKSDEHMERIRSKLVDEAWVLLSIIWPVVAVQCADVGLFQTRDQEIRGGQTTARPQEIRKTDPG